MGVSYGEVTDLDKMLLKRAVTDAPKDARLGVIFFHVGLSSEKLNEIREWTTTFRAPDRPGVAIRDFMALDVLTMTELDCMVCIVEFVQSQRLSKRQGGRHVRLAALVMVDQFMLDKSNEIMGVAMRVADLENDEPILRSTTKEARST